MSDRFKKCLIIPSWAAENSRGDIVALTGGCFCGRVRYQIDSLLRSGRSCHCSRCRKAFSGAGSAYAEVEPGSFSWLSGDENLTFYETMPGWDLCLVANLWNHAVRYSRRQGAWSDPRKRRWRSRC
ncbi:GFA family protein [Tolypothrix bouteillei]